MKHIRTSNQNNFIIGSFEHKNNLTEKLEFELQKSEKIGEYLDLLEMKIAETQGIADSLLFKKNTNNTE